MNIEIALMCGGDGSRLWPLSCKTVPKQFAEILNKDTTMFELTMDRIRYLEPTKIHIITSVDNLNNINQYLEKNYIDIPVNLILEPMRKDTAAVVGLISIINENNTNILVLSVDHIWNNVSFKEMIQQGIPYVDNSLVFFGIVPTYPETGYGYIEYNDDTLLKFIEKPDQNVAQLFYQNKNKFLWNSGNFLFNTDQMKQLFQQHQPEMLLQLQDTLCNSDYKINNNVSILSLNTEFFDKLEKNSIDYAIMNHVTNAKVIKYNDVWFDIGSYASIYSYNRDNHDKNDNLVQSDSVVLNDTKNCFIRSDTSQTIAGSGLDNLAIVNTRDALLVCNMNKTQDVKTIYKMLENTNPNVVKYPNKVFRPWGWYMSIEGDDYSGFKVKRIGVNPGKKLSLQSHAKRSEHWVIIKGNAKVQVGEDFHILHKNQHVYIPIGVLHRMENIGNEIVEFIETQIGEYLGEDDIKRFQDDFGRV